MTWCNGARVPRRSAAEKVAIYQHNGVKDEMSDIGLKEQVPPNTFLGHGMDHNNYFLYNFGHFFPMLIAESQLVSAAIFSVL